MRKLATTMTAGLLSLSLTIMAFGQSEQYRQIMQQQVDRLNGLEDPVEFQELANSFERIAKAEQDQWLPYYYAAYCHVVQAFLSEVENDAIRRYADKAQELIDQAAELSPDNPEILCVKSMILSSRISINPPINGPLYGPKSGAMLEKAQQLDPENPRTYYLQGQSAFHTPPMFGGGKDKAKPMLEEALEKFKTFEPESSIHPAWGEKGARDLLDSIGG